MTLLCLSNLCVEARIWADIIEEHKAVEASCRLACGSEKPGPRGQRQVAQRRSDGLKSDRKVLTGMDHEQGITVTCKALEVVDICF